MVEPSAGILVATRTTLTDRLCGLLRMNRLTFSKYCFCYLGLIPVFVIYWVLRLDPIARTFILSFYDWHLIQSAKTTRSSGMGADSARATTTGANRSGCGAESARHARKPSRSCPSGSHRRQTTLCAVEGMPVSGSPQGNPLSKPHHTAKTRPVYRIPPPCADGRNSDCLACAPG